jgi:[pyruvate, water dikinase]-phosphate phosphotransferase / [pyruvate, water dikinase] kinase
VAVAEALNIFIVSDATGSTAEAVVTSSLVQFRGAQSNVRRFPFVRSEAQVEEVVNEAPAGECIIVFTFVSRELADTMVRRGGEKNLTVVDVMSPLMDIFADILEHAPSRTPGAFRSESEETYLVTEAIAYTLQHDDGGGISTLHQADLIILGVSRTGKTPTSIFLSCRKLRVANIPIILDMPLPDAVTEFDTPKVGFKMEFERQVRLRADRASRHSTRIPGYSDPSNILAELEYADGLFRRIPGIRTVNVTNRSIEETSDWITHNVL